MSEVEPEKAVGKILIVEDDRLLRDSLRMLIGGSAGFACVGAAGSMEEALASPVKPPSPCAASSGSYARAMRRS